MGLGTLYKSQYDGSIKSILVIYGHFRTSRLDDVVRASPYKYILNLKDSDIAWAIFLLVSSSSTVGLFNCFVSDILRHPTLPFTRLSSRYSARPSTWSMLTNSGSHHFPSIDCSGKTALSPQYGGAFVTKSPPCLRAHERRLLQ